MKNNVQDNWLIRSMCVAFQQIQFQISILHLLASCPKFPPKYPKLWVCFSIDMYSNCFMYCQSVFRGARFSQFLCNFYAIWKGSMTHRKILKSSWQLFEGLVGLVYDQSRNEGVLHKKERWKWHENHCFYIMHPNKEILVKECLRCSTHSAWIAMTLIYCVLSRQYWPK